MSDLLLRAAMALCDGRQRLRPWKQTTCSSHAPKHVSAGSAPAQAAVVEHVQQGAKGGEERFHVEGQQEAHLCTGVAWEGRCG